MEVLNASCERARERLHVSRAPEHLPCREDEFSRVYSHLLTALEEGRGECLYISGVPGTGKTATVMRVIHTLECDSRDGTVPAFDFVSINGMKLTDPNQAYVTLWRELNKRNNSVQKRLTASHAQTLLEKHFSAESARQSRRMAVVLMDELDLLVTKKQTVMYNFFDWPNRPCSQLIVIAVANTMDLPERVLSNRVASRLGLVRINFAPYNFQQLSTIVTSRLEGVDAFESDAIIFCARKVSSVTGDARRALDICRRATELLQEQALLHDKENVGGKRTRAKSSPRRCGKMTTRVTIELVSRAIREMSTTPTILAIQNGSKNQKLFLWALVRAINRAGTGDTTLRDVFQEFSSPHFQPFLQKLAAGAHLNSGWIHPAHSLVLQPRKGQEGTILSRIYLSSVAVKSFLSFWASNRIVLTSNSHDNLDIRIRLNVSEEDVGMAIRAGKDDDIRKLVTGASC